METSFPELPPTRSQIRCRGAKAMRFWVRMFHLETDIEIGQRRLAERNAQADEFCVVPVINEYRVNEELLFIYVLYLELDVLGVRDGFGLILAAGPKYEAEALARRDRIGNAILKDVKERLEHQPNTTEIFEVPTRKEE